MLSPCLFRFCSRRLSWRVPCPCLNLTNPFGLRWATYVDIPAATDGSNHGHSTPNLTDVSELPDELERLDEKKPVSVRRVRSRDKTYARRDKTNDVPGQPAQAKVSLVQDCESLQKLFLGMSLGRKSSSVVATVAQNIMDHRCHLKYSAKDLFNSVRVFHFHRKLVGHSLLTFCLSKLQKEVASLAVADIPLLVNTVITLELHKDGLLLNASTEQFAKNLSSASPKLIIVFVEQLVRTCCLPTDFGNEVVKHTLEIVDEFAVDELASLVLSFAFAGLAAGAELLDPLDKKLAAKYADAGKVEHQVYCTAVLAFAKYRFTAPVSQGFLRNTFFGRQMAFSAHEFASAAIFLCLQCDYTDYEFCRVMQRGTQRLWPVFGSEHLALLSMVLVKLSKSNHGVSFAEAFAERVALRASELRVDSIIRILDSFQSVDGQAARNNYRLVSALFSVLTSRLVSLGPSAISKMAATVSALGLRHSALLNELSKYALKLLLLLGNGDHTKMNLLCEILLVLASLNVSDASLAAELHKCLDAGTVVGTIQQRVSLTWACVVQNRIPHEVLRSSLFTPDLAPSGNEPIHHLRRLRDLHVLAREEFGMSGFTDENTVQKLHHIVGLQSFDFAIPSEASEMLRSIYGNEIIRCNSMTSQGLFLPAAALFDIETGTPVPWREVDVDLKQPLPCPKMLAEKHQVAAVAVFAPSLVLPDRIPNGETILLERVLSACGWKVAMLSAVLWNRLGSEAQKASFLKQLLAVPIQEQQTWEQ